MGTELSRLEADELGRSAVSALLARSGVDPERVDEVIFGCVGQPARTPNLARVIALRAGVPERVPAVTVQRNCASGFESLTQAAEKNAAGSGQVFIVGGVESMSRAPFLFREEAREKWTRLGRAAAPADKLRALAAFRPRDFLPVPALKMALRDPVCEMSMGTTAETLAREFHIGRKEQDAFARSSHRKAGLASAALLEEIAPVFPGNGRVLDADNGIRSEDKLEKLEQLPPVFERRGGTVTAGNSSQVTDGAVALLVASEAMAEKLGIEPLGRLADWHYSGCDPARMGLGPAHAIADLFRHTRGKLEDFDLFEINEAFAAQVLAVLRALESPDYCRRHLGWESGLGRIPEDRLNVSGGAIAIGHPVGATGARLVLTALKELRRRKQTRALAAACVGGGQGVAVHLEKP
jgi:acetyl-CoA C-acetyltransferase/acetyl-CoA acyltransferase